MPDGCGANPLLNTVKIPPRVMFLTQIYGTILGGFVSYAVMISIVNGNRELLADGNGSSAWSGATMQSYNTNAASWALAQYLYKAGTKYAMVPAGLGIGAAIVAAHRVFTYVSAYYCARPWPCYALTQNVSSLFPRYETLTHLRSTFPSLSNTPATFHIMRHRPACSLAS